MKEFVVSRHRPDFSGQTAQPARLRVDDQGILTWASASAEQMFGYGGGRIPGMRMRKLVATAQDDPLAPAHNDSLQRGESLTLTFRHEDGYFFTGALILGASHVDADNAARASIKALPDEPIDMRQLRQIETSAPLGIWELTIQGNSILWSEGMYRILDLRPGLELDPEHALFYFQEGQSRVRAALRRCLQKGRGFRLELPIVSAKQRRRWVRLTGQPQYQGEQIRAVTGTLVDISAEQAQLSEVKHWKQLLKGFLAATSDLVVAMDPHLQIMALNDAFATQFEASFGVRPKVGDKLAGLLANHPNESRLYQRLWERAMDRETFCVEMPLAQHNRELPVYEFHYHRLTDAQGDLLGAAHLARDMSSRLGGGHSLNYLSSHDPLTGLLNRREFLQRLKRALGNAADNGSAQALLYIDLDHFEKLNEVHGPGACDRYLRDLASHLSNRTRQRDALARVGGDKFAILFDNCEEAESRKVAANLIAAVDSFTFSWQGNRLQTNASGGLVPFTAKTAGQPEELLALAADLCQTAKSAGRARMHVYRDQANSAAESEARCRIHELQSAIESDLIELRFQTIKPIASATWGDYIEIFSQLKLEGTEGPWQPDDFIPVAERFDLASRFDRMVIAKTLVWLNHNPVMEARLKMCSFNLSLASLLDPDFVDLVSNILANSRYSPGIFCFEVRESDAARHPDAVEALCRGFHELGCKVALDGVGGSAQSYTLISRLPVDVVKLDARLMKSLAEDPIQQVMVEALQKVAEVSGKVTIAQYIEDDPMLKQARELGIHYGQGFRLSLPKPLAELAPPRWAAADARAAASSRQDR